MMNPHFISRGGGERGMRSCTPSPTPLHSGQNIKHALGLEKAENSNKKCIFWQTKKNAKFPKFI